MLATAVSNNLAESRTNKFPFMAASVGGLFQFVRFWHIASFAAPQHFVRFWTRADNSWHRRCMAQSLMMLWTAPTLRHRSAIGWLRQSKPH